LEPKLLLLDEPFSGLSSEDSFRLTHLIQTAKENGVTILIVEHKLRLLANLVDRIMVLNNGIPIALATPQEISQLYNSGAGIVYDAGGTPTPATFIPKAMWFN